MPVIFVPEEAYKRLLKLAEEKGAAGVENLIPNMAADDMGSREAAEAYWEASQRLAEAAEGELAKGRLRQASERIWGSAALAVKALAIALEGRRLASQGSSGPTWTSYRLSSADPS